MELGIEELYLEALVKEVGLEISSKWCPLCTLKHEPSPFTVEEGFKIIEIMAGENK